MHSFLLLLLIQSSLNGFSSGRVISALGHGMPIQPSSLYLDHADFELTTGFSSCGVSEELSVSDCRKVVGMDEPSDGLPNETVSNGASTSLDCIVDLQQHPCPESDEKFSFEFLQHSESFFWKTKRSLLDMEGGVLGPAPDDSESVAAKSPAKFVVAHHIVGNTLPYTEADWVSDINMAAGNGLDGFVLNVGRDPWQPQRVSDAYSAALTSGSNFKLFISFDMSSLPCSSIGDASTLRSYITTYATHPSQFLFNGLPVFSTFSGQGCSWGTENSNEGWTQAIKAAGLPQIHFIPAFFVPPSSLPTYTVADGDFNWNGAWPLGDYDVNFNSDDSSIAANGGKSYMASVSPWFFTHYGPNSYNKNWIYRADDWLFSNRWEMLIANRQHVDIVQVLTWNDYGESHYIGPMKGAQDNSQSWTSGFDHTAWLDLAAFYSTAFKTGQYPAFSNDKIYIWSRPYPGAATAPDPVGRPNNWQWTQDFLWAVVFCTAPATATLLSGSTSQSFDLLPGISKLKMPLSVGQQGAMLTRDGLTVIDMQPPGFLFEDNPPNYNFNARVVTSST